jgi:hypothetical protein
MAESKAKRAAEVLLGLLDRQRQLYRRLLELANQQADLVTVGNPDGLLAVLAQRQTLLEEIKKTNDSLAPFRQRWDDVTRLLDDQQRAEASAAISEINERLQQIMQRDQTDSETLQLRCRKIGQELQTARTGRSAVRAYGTDESVSRHFNEAVE